MVAKIYKLYQDAYQHEEAEKKRKEDYRKPKGTSNRVLVEETEEVIDMTQDSGFG